MITVAQRLMECRKHHVGNSVMTLTIKALVQNASQAEVDRFFYLHRIAFMMLNYFFLPL